MIATLRESKAKLSALVERAAAGEEVVITVRGKPKARLCPIADPAPKEQRDAPFWGNVLRDARATYSTGKHDSADEILEDLRGERQ